MNQNSQYWASIRIGIAYCMDAMNQPYLAKKALFSTYRISPDTSLNGLYDYAYRRKAGFCSRMAMMYILILPGLTDGGLLHVPTMISSEYDLKRIPVLYCILCSNRALYLGLCPVDQKHNQGIFGNQQNPYSSGEKNYGDSTGVSVLLDKDTGYEGF